MRLGVALKIRQRVDVLDFEHLGANQFTVNFMVSNRDVFRNVKVTIDAVFGFRVGQLGTDNQYFLTLSHSLRQCQVSRPPVLRSCSMFLG